LECSKKEGIIVELMIATASAVTIGLISFVLYRTRTDDNRIFARRYNISVKEAAKFRQELIYRAKRQRRKNYPYVVMNDGTRFLPSNGKIVVEIKSRVGGILDLITSDEVYKYFDFFREEYTKS
jgi:hypothetical protein